MIESVELEQKVTELRLELARAKADLPHARQIYNESKDNGEALRFTKDKILQIQRKLDDALAEKERREASAKRPGLAELVEAVKKLLDERDSHAERCAAALDIFREELLHVDNINLKLHKLTRDPALGGVEAVSQVFHPIHASQRLRPALRAACANTSYSDAVRRHAGLHSPDPERSDFAYVEKQLSHRLLGILESQLQAIDALQNKKEETA